MHCILKRIFHLLTVIICMNAFNAFYARHCKIAFFVNLLTVRGTEVSIYDYADCNEAILGNESIIVNWMPPGRHINCKIADRPESVRNKFTKRFENRFYDISNLQEMDAILLKEHVDILYIQKAGANDGKISRVCKNAVHAVFPELQVHGQVYACISEWLSSVAPSLNLPYVPYMVKLDSTSETLHNQLHIPQGAVVFGRHGGSDTFDIPFAKETVQEIARAHTHWYFLFLNTEKFCNLPNVIFLPATPDVVYKTKFINTCDVMIHARQQGETFGLACAEFSIKNKPIITWYDSSERSHIEILGNKGLYYRNKQELSKHILECGKNIQEVRSKNWDMYSNKFNPQSVMSKFDEVFIRPLMN